MKLFMYAVFDSAAKVYDRPFCCRSEGEAIRGFSDVCSDANHQFGKHPEHYSLWEVGMYDDNKAKIEPVVARHVASGHELVAQSRIVDPAKIDLMEKAIDGNGVGTPVGVSDAS